MSLTPAAAADLFRAPPERFLDVGHGEIAYRTVGAGPDVVFVHGFPVNSATFRCLLPHLADHVTCHLLDLPGAGSSRFGPDTPVSVENHIHSVQRSVELLELDNVAVVGHDSGGLIARHAMVENPAMRALGLINTEPSVGVSWRFRSFLTIRHVPRSGRLIGWAARRPRISRNKFVFGDAFADRSLLGGEFDEFFLAPLRDRADIQDAATKLLKSFGYDHIEALAGIHSRIDVPVQLVWGDRDPFFPIASARADAASFSNAELAEIPGAGLFSHEERPAEVAAALLPTLLGER